MAKKKRKTWWIWVLIILALLAGAAFYISRQVSAAAERMEMLMGPKEKNYTVARGTIERSVTASGTLSAPDTELVWLADGLKPSMIPVKVGDAVSKDDILAVFEPRSVVEQVQYIAKKTEEASNRLSTAGLKESIKSPAKGRLKYMPVSAGQDVLEAMEQYGCLAVLSTDGYMRMEIQTDRTLELGSRRTVQYEGGSAKGIVRKKTEDGYIILVPDDHAPYLGEGTVLDEDGSAIGSGVMEVNLPVRIYGHEGVIDRIRGHIDESVPDGRELFAIRYPGVNTSYATRYASQRNYSDTYQELISYLNDYTLRAPCDGIVAEILIREGEKSGTTGNAETENIAFRISTGGATILTVNADELDVLSLETGQKAEITLDADLSNPVSGTVSRIGRIGQKDNSIAEFPVEIRLENDPRLRIGMNATARIFSEYIEGILMIPVDAIEEDGSGEYVYLKKADGSSARTRVVTGKSDGEYAEVTDGLSEGDVITYSVSQEIDFSTLLSR